MSNGETLKPLPDLVTDEDAEQFIAEASLEDYDLSGLTMVSFQFGGDPEFGVRLPAALVDAVKMKAKARGMSYQRFIREAIERALEDSP